MTIAPSLEVRHCQSSDIDEIARIMNDTMLLGQPIPGAHIDEYVNACLSGYRTTGRGEAVVCRAGDAVVGYALISLNPREAEHHAIRQARQLAASVLLKWVTGRLSAPTRRFYRLRTRDVVALMRGGRHRRHVPHAHVNVVSGARSGLVARALLDHIDETVRDAGHDMWMGEMNAHAGSRESALQRLGFTVVARSRNHTLSGFSGRRVDRLTVQRRVTSHLSS